MHVLVLHTVETNGNSRKSLTAALLPLKQSVPLLKHQIDILLLLFVKVYFFLVLRIPYGKFVKSAGDIFIKHHIRELLILYRIFTLLPFYQLGV